MTKDSTQLVFKLEKEPQGYGQIFAQNCEFDLHRASGPVYIDPPLLGETWGYRPITSIGTYSNLRREGELILADIELFDKYRDIVNLTGIEYSMAGKILAKNDRRETTKVLVGSVHGHLKRVVKNG